jgi:hypothetical protein
MLWGELSTHLALQALFAQISPVCEPLLQAFLFPSTLGKVTLHLRCQACVFIYSSHGKWALPPLLWSFPPSATLTSFPAPGCWLLGARPRSRQSLSGPPCLFIYSPGKDSLPPIFTAQGAPPSFPLVFIVLIAYYSVSLFFPGGGQSVQGAVLLWPRLVCGSTAVPQSSPGLRLPKPSGHGRLAARGPSLFLRLT